MLLLISLKIKVLFFIVVQAIYIEQRALPHLGLFRHHNRSQKRGCEHDWRFSFWKRFPRLETFSFLTSLLASWRHEKGIKQTDALRHHGDFKLFFFFEIINELLKGHFAISVFENEPIPKGPFFSPGRSPPEAVVVGFGLISGGFDGIGEGNKR